MGGQRLIVCALAALLPLLATAEEQGGSRACRADAQKYCANEKDKKECLIDHQKDISDGCYDFLKKAIKQGSVDAPASEAPFTATAYSSPIYKVKTAEGRTVYTNAAVPNGAEVKDRNNIALPIR